MLVLIPFSGSGLFFVRSGGECGRVVRWFMTVWMF